MDALAVVILAAGLGKRMGLDTPKVTVSTRERSLIQHVLITANHLAPDRTIVVTGHKRELVEESVHAGAKLGLYSDSKISFALQEKQLGTGDAVKAALPALKGFVGTILILYGDTPLISVSTLQRLLKQHRQEKATLTMLVLHALKDFAYGRIIRDSSGNVTGIVERKDCSPEQIQIPEQNSGVYAVDSAFLGPAVSELKNDNAQKEYYLTDIVERAAKEGQRVSSITTYDANESQGVNTLPELSRINQILLQDQISRLITSGVEILDPNSVIIDSNVVVEAGTCIGPNVQILKGSKIGRGVQIEGTAYISNCQIGENAVIKLGVRMEDSSVQSDASVGPFANLRPGTQLGEGVKIGNFVETKNAKLEKEAKASHLTYLGDCEIGEHSNIGAGTITCNYDGVNKNKTSIGKNVFIGSDSCLVAPVTINDGAYIGAGSVITKSVEKGALAFTRPPMVVKPGWADKKREK